MAEPMSDERLAEWRKVLEWWNAGDLERGESREYLGEALEELLPEVDRLRAELAAARQREEAALAVVRVVAAPSLQVIDDVVNVIECDYCGENIDDTFVIGDPAFDAVMSERTPFPHRDDCLALQARALLARSTGEGR